MSKSDKTKVEMFGVRYPDGTVLWDDGHMFEHLRTPEDRAKFLLDRKAKLKHLGLKDDPGVTFLKRYRVIYHTQAEIIS